MAFCVSYYLGLLSIQLAFSGLFTSPTLWESVEFKDGLSQSFWVSSQISVKKINLLI